MKVLSNDPEAKSDYAGDEQKIEQNMIALKTAKNKFADIMKEKES